MERARNVSAFGVMVSDSSRGRVDAPLGVPRIRYDLDREDAARFKRGIERLAEAYWAAGATEVLAPIRGLPPLRDGDSGPLRDAEVRARDLELMAFHPLGTARMGSIRRTRYSTRTGGCTTSRGSTWPMPARCPPPSA